MKQREERLPVSVPARYRGDQGWEDAIILNLSEHGLCFKSSKRVRSGHYLELRRGSHVIVARVVWSAEGKCGARTQDVIPVFDIINDHPAERKKFGLAVVDRRTAPRPQAPGWQRFVGQKMEYLTIGAVALLAAAGIGHSVYTALSVPMAAVKTVLVSDR